MEVARLHARLEQVVGQVLGHLLRQRRDEDTLADLFAAADLVQQVVDLVARLAQLDLRVDQEGRADQLFADDRRVAQLERAGRRRHEHELRNLPEELVEAQRPVVECRRQTEAVVDERLLARAVAFVHPADLRDGLVRLVHEDDEVVREVVQQRERMRPRRAAFEDAGVVLDAVAEAELLEHLEVVLRALPEPVGLEHLVLGLELAQPLLELVLDLVDCALDRRLRRDVLGRRPDGEIVELRVDLAAQRIEVRDLLDLVAEERHAVRRLLVRGLDLDNVALDAKAPAAENRVVADVLRVDQLAQEQIAVVLLVQLEVDHPIAPLLRRAQAVDARDRGDDDHVAPREQRRGRVEAKARDVVVL